MFAALTGRKFFSVNCHLHLETSDFLGGLRPVRHTRQVPINHSAMTLWQRKKNKKVNPGTVRDELNQLIIKDDLIFRGHH